jgi:hypothetical protein
MEKRVTKSNGTFANLSESKKQIRGFVNRVMIGSDAADDVDGVEKLPVIAPMMRY